MPLFASSYIKTVAAAVTRARDQLSYSYTAKPQVMTVYVRFMESGNGLTTDYLLHIGDSTTFFRIAGATGGFYVATISNGISSVLPMIFAGIVPSLGQSVELCTTINPDGSLTGRGSINGGTEVTTGPTVGTRILPVAWGAQTLWVNSLSTTNVGFLAVRNIEIRRGVLDMSQMRTYAGT